MERVTKKIIKYTQQKWEDTKAMNMFKMLRQEVDLGANGTQKYTLKENYIRMKKMIDFILRKIEHIASRISAWIWKIRVNRLFYKKKRK